MATIEDWARSYIESTSLETKCSPPPLPTSFAASSEALDLRPFRPVELKVTLEKPKGVKRGALERVDARARLHHKFWHHELQAAELMCWAVLRFPDTPEEFRRGLLRIFRDEVRHMKLYEEHLGRLGYGLSDFPVRDWFWDRVPTCQTPTAFVALLGMGLEGANLEHTERFATWFRAVGDVKAAEIQDQVGQEEIAHVRFAIRWFHTFAGDISFSTWMRHLPAPLSPLLMKGRTLHKERRRKANFPDEFVRELEAWSPDPVLGHHPTMAEDT